MSAPFAYRRADALVRGDLMPTVCFGPGAVVESVTPRGAGMLRVEFLEPVHSRFMPGTTITGLTFYPDDRVIVRVCEAVWPSPVTGGLTDAQCVEAATVKREGMWLCPACAGEVMPAS